ncbi:PIG-L deacetylase family protein [Neobacillus cucumis]|uniref:PIG-L deacetylase family protein n=1 Tax=Neobacillus cucumis TaxID=1740721 RepID=UPI001964F4A7|nr:PIG-L deacetylase family protein [Neobacillus cucumis]MBM7652292.1 LmbE family N-acetylglucosaminyl deacetylase [Neobacillus cucumis]MED4228577.1 PIG-L family deacetylase [Neobacillus cucumis]
MRNHVLVIAAHPDDELLGSGGTIKKLINNGYQVTTVIAAKGRKEEEHQMKPFMLKANEVLGVEEVIFIELPNLLLESIPLIDIIKKIEDLIKQKDPVMIFTHHYGDLNRDHQVLFQAVLTAARPLPGTEPIEIICFETVSSSEWSPHTNDKEFKPNYFVDITDTIEDKLNSLQHYDVEMRPFPHPRSYEGVRSLAKVRGMTVGVNYAEAFEVIRRVWK